MKSEFRMVDMILSESTAVKQGSVLLLEAWKPRVA